MDQPLRRPLLRDRQRRRRYVHYGDFGEYRVERGRGIGAALAYSPLSGFLGALLAKTFINGQGGCRFLVSFKKYR